MVGKIQFKKIRVLIVLCFFITALLSYKSGLEMPLALTVVFAPIYEEAIFRGWILEGLKSLLATKWAILISAGLFGLWHLKNLSYLESSDVLYQMAWAGLILGPIFGYVAVKTKSVWPGVLLHYLNNIGSLVLMMVSLDWRTLF